MTGDFCGTRYGVRLHLASDQRLCHDCAAVVTDALARRAALDPPPTRDAAIERDIRRLVALIDRATKTPPDRRTA